jgi:hypothetical protein
MGLVAKKREYELLNEGLHNATITRVEDLGKQETQFGTKEQAAIYFTSADQKDKEGNAVDARMRVSTESLHPKSNVAKLLTQLGVPFGSSFDLNDLVGIKCQVVIQHKETEQGTFANIVSVLKLKGKPAPAAPAEQF